MAGKVLVTGGTGYIAGELIDQLLARGHAVNTTVRNLAKGEQRLRARWPEAGERLAVFEADLLDDAGWAEANAGCTAVAHVASPFPLGIPRDKDELVVPAREGTLRALRFAHEAGIERFVQTSSAAAIAYGQPEKDHFDYTDWTNLSGGVPPYIESKTVAERAARDWVAVNAHRMVFCSVNPVGVFGPVHDADISTSIEIVKQMLEGRLPALPDIGISITDVRDVARAHVLAIEAPAAQVRGERFPTATRFMWLSEVAALFKAQVPELARKVPTRKMPNWLVRLLAVFIPDLRQITGELGNKRELSGTHTEEVLGFTFIAPETTLLDTAHSLAERGILKR